MSMLGTSNPSREDYVATEKTKQAFKDQCDVNKILARAQVKGGLSHVQKYPHAVYGEFDGEMDLLTAHHRIEKANAIFADLPSEVRSEFRNDPMAFVKWAGQQTPEELVEKIPAIAQPGAYFPNPVQRGGQGAGAATAPTESVAASFTEDTTPPTAESSEASNA